MALSYRGREVTRIKFLWRRSGGEAMFFIETANPVKSCVVPLGSIGAEGGAGEVLEIAKRSDGAALKVEGKNLVGNPS